MYFQVFCVLFSVPLSTAANEGYYHEQKKHLANGVNGTVKSMAFKAWENVGPLTNSPNIIKVITNVATTIGSATICGKHCLRTPKCCGFYYKIHDYCKLVNTSRTNKTSVVEQGTHYFEILSICTRNKTICGRGECVPHFHNNSYSCIQSEDEEENESTTTPEPQEYKINGYINGSVFDTHTLQCSSRKVLFLLYHAMDIKYHTAILFENIGVNKNAVIKGATIQLKQTANSQGTIPYDIHIAAKKIPNAQANDTTNCDFKSLLTDSVALWEGPHPVVAKGETFRTADFKNVVQEIVDMDDWVSTNGIMIVFFNPDIATKNAEYGEHLRRYKSTPSLAVLAIDT